MRVLHYVDAENISWLASDIEPLKPLASGPLVPTSDVSAWTEAIRTVL